MSGEDVDAIQPFGFAILVSGDWLVERVSANLGDYLAADPLAAIGRPLSDLLCGDAVHSIRNRLALMREPTGFTRLFSCRAGSGEARFDFIVQHVGKRVLLEGRPSGPAEHGDATETVRALIARLGAGKGVSQLLSEAARQLRAMTGYDRVAIYRIEGDDAATLVAQSARKMASAPVRLLPSLRHRPIYIADRDADCVPLLPKAASGACKQALFGAVSAAHRQGLEQQGSAAAVTSPLRVGGAVWGMICCEHPIARTMLLDREAAFELYADMLGMKIEICELRAA